MSEALEVVFASSEAMPWSHTGGLAEVAAALPAALHGRDIGGKKAAVTVVLPLYRATTSWARNNGRILADTGIAAQVALGGQRLEMALRQWTDESGLRWVFIDCPSLFERDGLYDQPGGQEFGDNPLRFGAFCRTVLQGVPLLLDGPPAILHAHDWQTALLPVWLTTERPVAWRGCASVFTIHNLAYQGVYSKGWLPRLGLPWQLFSVDGLEFWDQLNLLKGGIVFADALTTVSPTYASEILQPAAGEGLDGLLRRHSTKLEGILNGVDMGAWNPKTDGHIAATYSAEDLSGKATCRDALLAEMGLQATTSQPIFGVVSRFAWQKGLDLVADCVSTLIQHDARLVVLGSGDRDLEARFAEMARQHPEYVAVRLGFDVGLAHRIEAGADAFLMPSRYEPCGLNQMFSMAYGTVPVVHAVGGLADTVVAARPDTLSDGTATGFAFGDADAAGLRWAIDAATHAFKHRPSDWRALMSNGMRRDHSWTASARRYAELYWRIACRMAGV